MWNPHTLTPSTILSVGNLLSFVFIFTAWSWYCCQFPPNRRRIKIKERSSSPCTAQTGTRIEAENSGRSKTNRYEISRTGNIFFYAGLRSRENSLDIQAKLGLTKNLTTPETIARLNKPNLGRRIFLHHNLLSERNIVLLKSLQRRKPYFMIICAMFCICLPSRQIR